MCKSLFYKNSDKVNFSFNQKFENLFQYEIASITNRTGNDCKIWINQSKSSNQCCGAGAGAGIFRAAPGAGTGANFFYRSEPRAGADFLKRLRLYLFEKQKIKA